MSWLHTHLAMPLTEPDRCAGLAGRLRAIRRFERLTDKAQRQEQQLRLQRLLQHAFDTVPYYRHQFKRAGFQPGDATLDRPLSLPALTRENVRIASKSLVSTAFSQEKLRIAASSGTAGVPIRFHRDAEAVRNKVALKLKLDEWAGYNPGDSTMMFWGENSSISRESNWRWRAYEGIYMRQTPPPPGTVGLHVLERWRWRYEKQRPKTLYGRATVIAAFAAFLQERGVRHRPRTVITTAEVLNDDSRKLIASVFGSSPFNHYGNREAGMMAAECSEHEGMHFHPWGSHVEFDAIGDSAEGPVYRLLVTDLLNYGQPFIRYDTGDCVTLTEQSCSCGRWFPLVRQIIGRLVNGTVMANGVPVADITIAGLPNAKRAISLPIPALRKRPQKTTAERRMRGRTSLSA